MSRRAARIRAFEKLLTREASNMVYRPIESGVSVYDTLFVELAARSSCPLLTFDKAVVKAFPEIARRPRDLVGR